MKTIHVIRKVQQGDTESTERAEAESEEYVLAVEECAYLHREDALVRCERLNSALDTNGSPRHRNEPFMYIVDEVVLCE